MLGLALGWVGSEVGFDLGDDLQNPGDGRITLLVLATDLIGDIPNLVLREGLGIAVDLIIPPDPLKDLLFFVAEVPVVAGLLLEEDLVPGAVDDLVGEGVDLDHPAPGSGGAALAYAPLPYQFDDLLRQGLVLLGRQTFSGGQPYGVDQWFGRVQGGGDEQGGDVLVGLSAMVDGRRDHGVTPLTLDVYAGQEVDHGGDLQALRNPQGNLETPPRGPTRRLLHQLFRDTQYP